MLSGAFSRISLGAIYWYQDLAAACISPQSCTAPLHNIKKAQQRNHHEHVISTGLFRLTPVDLWTQIDRQADNQSGRRRQIEQDQKDKHTCKHTHEACSQTKMGPKD